MISKEEAREALKNMEENFQTLYVVGQRNDFAVDWCILHCIANGIEDPGIEALDDNRDLIERINTIEGYLRGWWQTGNIDCYMQQTLAYWNVD